MITKPSKTWDVGANDDSPLKFSPSSKGIHRCPRTVLTVRHT